MTAILKITDGTTTVDLLGGTGYMLDSWRPAIAQYKGGGSWRESSISDGRRMVQKVFGNVVETFNLKLVGGSQDSAIATSQRLRHLLEQASDYWVDRYANSPVWIEAKATGETNARYAILHYGVIPEDENPYAQPFLQPDCAAVMDSLTLIIERGHWMDNVPGMGECVEISGIQRDWGVVTGDATFVPSAGTDDAYVEHGDANIFTGADFLWMGSAVTDRRYRYETGIRFRNVTIPAGATILSAAIRFTCNLSMSTFPVYLTIKGEDEGTPAAFSTYGDFVGRERTSNYVDWDDLPAWVLGEAYDTPDISNIVQEIVNRGDWASGQDMVMFVGQNMSGGLPPVFHQSRRAASFEDTVYTEPELIIDYIGAPLNLGREATCEDDEVYVVNKHNIAQLTHVGIVDGGAWVANLLGSGTPYDLLPAVPVVGDAIWFGITTTVADAGPFSNLVFDIGTIQVDLEIDWYYWNGGWVALAVQDNTNFYGGMGGEAFDSPGVRSVHWEQPSDWLAADPGGIVGATAYWVKAEVTGIGANPAPPEQQNRDVYTITWPYIEVNEDQIDGDIDPMLALSLTNVIDGDVIECVVDDVMGGLRSVSRGEDYTAYINLGVSGTNTQNPNGITIIYGANTAANTPNPVSQTGVSAQYTPAADMQVEITVNLDYTIAHQYIGNFHAYLRYTQDNSSADYTFARITIRNSDTEEIIFRSDVVGLYNTNAFATTDMGKIHLTPTAIAAGDYTIYEMDVEIELGGTGPTTIDFYDLILVPTDEFAFRAVNRAVASTIPGISGTAFLSLDGITSPKRMICAEKLRLNSRILSLFTYLSPLRPMLRWDGGTQRMWFFSHKRESATYIDDDSAPIDIAFSFRNKAVKRYLSMRGNQ